jgi:hypothetical protein
MKSHPLSSKIAKLIGLIHSERQAYIDSNIIRKLLDMINNIPKDEQILRELILSYLQKIESPQLQQLIHDELTNSFMVKLGYEVE